MGGCNLAMQKKVAVDARGRKVQLRGSNWRNDLGLSLSAVEFCGIPTWTLPMWIIKVITG